MSKETKRAPVPLTPLQQGKKSWEKLSDYEKEAWNECNWCYSHSCINCSYQKVAEKHGWNHD